MVSGCRRLCQVRPAAAPLDREVVLDNQQKDKSPPYLDVRPAVSSAFAAPPACQDALVLLGLVPMPQLGFPLGVWKRTGPRPLT
jgi:hypothetical protein